MRAAVVALMAAFLLLAPAVLADSDGWEEEARDQEVRLDADTFELRSGRVGGEDEVRFLLDGDNVRFRLDFRDHRGDVEAEAELRVELERVFEFRDENGDGAFQEGEDVRAEHGPSDFDLQGLNSSAVSSGGIDGIQAAAVYMFRDAPGSTMTFRATAFGDVTAFQGHPLDPVEVKVDILFEDFPYEEGDTLPAFEARVDAPVGSGNLSADAIGFSAGNLTATFRWEDTATVDGIDRPVRTTVASRENESLSVTFAYARGADIVHDPTLGFSLREVLATTSRILGNPAFYALGVVASLAVFSGLVLIRRRKVKGSGPV